MYGVLGGGQVVCVYTGKVGGDQVICVYREGRR